MIEYNGKKYKPCPHCKGTGSKPKYMFTQGGICFQCDGWKSKELFQEIKAERDEASRLNTIEELKNRVAEFYIKMRDKERMAAKPAIARSYRQQAEGAYKALKALGVEYGLEEIESRAYEIEFVIGKADDEVKAFEQPAPAEQYLHERPL